MNLLFPHMTQFEESQRDLERDFRLRQQMPRGTCSQSCQADGSLRIPRDAPAALAAARTTFSPPRGLLADPRGRVLTRAGRCACVGRSAPVGYLTSVSILNIGRYIAMMITPTIRPTPIIITGSMMLVSVAIDASTSSS